MDKAFETFIQYFIDSLEPSIEKTLVKVLNADNSQTQEKEIYISVSLAARLLSVSRVTIYEYIKEGHFKKYKIGSTTRLLKAEVLSIVKPV